MKQSKLGAGRTVASGDGVKSGKITIWNRNFICVVIINTLLCLGHASVNPIVASYAKFLNASEPMMGLLTGMFYGVALAIRPVAGPVTTKSDKRTLLIAVFLIGGVANMGYALFQSIPMFVFFRFLTGIQYGFVGSLIMTLAGDSLPPEKMASGMGVYGVGAAVGTALAPSAGLYLLELGRRLAGDGAGFRMAFMFASAMMFISVIPSVVLLPDKKSKRDAADAGAWYTNILSVNALPGAAVMFFIIMAYSLYNVYIYEFAVERGIAEIGLFFPVTAGTLVFSRPFSGRLADRYGAQKTMYPGMAILALSFVVIATSRSLSTVLIGGVMAALGYGSTQPALQAMCLQSVTHIKRGVASNTVYIGMDLGLFLGPLYGSLVYESFNFSVMFMTGVIPIAIAIITFALIMPGYKRRREQLRD
ncbi:MAG: MFS transporter [Oscillospiraceae bacterium]|jgi:MFS family permease|nr:MFS transporter [Oscillospiraceae bacterium]